MIDDVYNPAPDKRVDTPTPGGQPQEPAPSRTLAVLSDELAASYRELMEVFAEGSEDDETDDQTRCEAVGVDDFMTGFDDGEDD